MTSEVVLMNRRALAMAADSAATVTRWVRGTARSRFFKGANKIYNLLAHQPVGMMVYANGTLQGVPWDVLAKSFREDFGSRTCEQLRDYGPKLFGWIERNVDAYPQEFQEQQLISEAITAAGRVCLPAVQAAFDEPDKAEQGNVMRAHFAAEVAKVRAASYLANLTEADLNKALAFKDQVQAGLANSMLTASASAHLDAAELAEVGIIAVFKADYSTLDETGIVIGGFGARDYFPQVESYTCHGIVLGKLVCNREEIYCRSISQANISEIVPFAKAEMIRTFAYGLGIKSLTHLDNALGRSLDHLETSLRTAGHIPADLDVSAQKAEARSRFSDDISSYLKEEHSDKLREVVSLLPVEELSELAETLVSIESLKERMTTDDESVGGPIDVAVISRNDGFIWMKRKHYFEPRLNPRYFAKFGSQAQENS